MEKHKHLTLQRKKPKNPDITTQRRKTLDKINIQTAPIIPKIHTSGKTPNYERNQRKNFRNQRKKPLKLFTHTEVLQKYGINPKPNIFTNPLQSLNGKPHFLLNQRNNVSKTRIRYISEYNRTQSFLLHIIQRNYPPTTVNNPTTKYEENFLPP